LRLAPVLAVVACSPAAAPGADRPTTPQRADRAAPESDVLRSDLVAAQDLFVAVPHPDSAASWVRRLSARPHLAGTPEAHATADSIADWLRALGFDVTIETFEPTLPHPGIARVGLTAPERMELRTSEPPARLDVADSAAVLTNWLAYSANGAVEAPVVYANYGLSADYDALAAAGIDVRGAIVLARFGRAYRGVKVAEAEGRGVAGVILYPDPAEDGFARGDTVPLGPYRPPWSVQRGTLMKMWVHTGDPLTPGRPARPGEPRLDPNEATNLPRIPATVIGYADATRILERLDGARVEGFGGALPLEYRTGPGPARVSLEVRHVWAQRPVRNVIARIAGRTPQYVILGNHFDAWVAGAADPHSGTAVMLEIARGLAAVKRDGWVPRRGITLAFWDAEEFGVVGSTEWVEAHVAELARDAVAYFNIDMFTAGILDVTGSPALRDLVSGAAARVVDPITGRTLLEEWRSRQGARRQAGATVSRDTVGVEIGDIGAGSDWTAFLHFAGIPSLQWTMNGRGRYAIYHSVLDDFVYYGAHVDSAFLHTPALARVMGLAALRLAEAELLPFLYARYADRIDRWLTEGERNADAAGGALAAIDFAAARDALIAFRRAVTAFDATAAATLGKGAVRAVADANARLVRVEASFLEPAGLRGRPWYRHVLNAPGSDTGYDALPLPELAEAIRADDAAGATAALTRIEAALRRATGVLRQ
jgi:N-acetylated-alpha-linked acidic dipeptidase